MKHQWILNEDGKVDVWQLFGEFHNGPECALCGFSRCEHCHDVYNDETCDGGIAKRKRIAEYNAQVEEKIVALGWALLSPEKWDEFNIAAPELAKHNRAVLSKMLLELEKSKMEAS